MKSAKILHLLLKNIKFNVILLIHIIFTINISFADISSSVNSFWGGLGDNVNVTQGGSYKTQTNTYYSGPSIYARSKVMNLQPVSIALPSIRAGCNGIDMFTGSFSHINSDQIVALLKQIPSNAKGFVVQMALDTISPTISNNIKQMLATLEKINSINLNSCDIAQGAVKGIARAAQPKFCQAVQAGNKGSDWARAVANCGAGGETSATINKTKSPTLDNVKPSNVNFAFEALKNKGLSESDLNMFISISGTLIKQLPNNDGGEEKIIPKLSKALDAEFINAVLSGGEIKMYKCSDIKSCLTLTEKTENIKPKDSLQSSILDMLNSITRKLPKNDESLSNAEKNLINKVTTIPILAQIKANLLNGGEASAILENHTLASVVAVEVILLYLEEVINIVVDGATNIKAGDSDDVEKFIKSINSVKSILLKQREEVRQKFTLSTAILSKIHKIEEVIANSESAMFGN